MISTVKAPLLLVIGTITLLGGGGIFIANRNIDDDENNIEPYIPPNNPDQVPGEKEQQPKDKEHQPEEKERPQEPEKVSFYQEAPTESVDNSNNTTDQGSTIGLFTDFNTTATKVFTNVQNAIERVKNIKDPEDAKALSRDVALSSEQLFQNQYFFFVGFLLEAAYLYSRRSVFLNLFARLSGGEVKDNSILTDDPELNDKLQTKRIELDNLVNQSKQLQSQEKETMS